MILFCSILLRGGANILLLIWLAFALTCYKVAEEKNRDKIFWGILGILFGLLTLMILVMLPKKRNY